MHRTAKVLFTFVDGVLDVDVVIDPLTEKDAVLGTSIVGGLCDVLKNFEDREWSKTLEKEIKEGISQVMSESMAKGDLNEWTIEYVYPENWPSRVRLGTKDLH